MSVVIRIMVLIVVAAESRSRNSNVRSKTDNSGGIHDSSTGSNKSDSFL